MRPENFIVKYLDQVRLMQIVTSRDNQPWAANVYFAIDNLHNIYWLSRTDRRHSINIKENPKVAGVIALPPTYGKPVQGVQFQGTARLVPPADVADLFESYAERYGVHSRLQAIQSGQDANQLYQLKPDLFVLFDEVNFPNDPRQEWRPSETSED